MNNLLLTICRQGQLHMLEWFSTWYTSPDHLECWKLGLHKACSYGHLDIAVWIHHRIADQLKMADYRTPEWHNAAFFACLSGYVEVVRWMYSLNPVVFEREILYKNARISGNPELIQWFEKLRNQ